MDDKQLTDDIRSSLWHIASALKGIELKLEELDTMSHSLIRVESAAEHFAEPFLVNSKFSRLVELIEKQTEILAEQQHMRQYRK